MSFTQKATMPLLDGKPHVLSTATPLSFRPDEQVFVLQSTGEIVSDFQRYTELHKLYRCKKWSSITGKNGLTFAEAAKEEEKNRALAEKVQPVLRSLRRMQPKPDVKLLRCSFHPILGMMRFTSSTTAHYGLRSWSTPYKRSLTRTGSEPTSRVASTLFPKLWSRPGCRR